MRGIPIIGVGWKVPVLLLALGAPGLAAQATSAGGP